MDPLMKVSICVFLCQYKGCINHASTIIGILDSFFSPDCEEAYFFSGVLRSQICCIYCMHVDISVKVLLLCILHLTLVV